MIASIVLTNACSIVRGDDTSEFIRKVDQEIRFHDAWALHVTRPNGDTLIIDVVRYGLPAWLVDHAHQVDVMVLTGTRVAASGDYAFADIAANRKGRHPVNPDCL